MSNRTVSIFLMRESIDWREDWARAESNLSYARADKPNVFSWSELHCLQYATENVTEVADKPIHALW